jgi:hypothetical protein
MSLDLLDTKPLLRPAALEAARDELKILEGKLHSPHIQDKGEVYRQIRALDKSLESQVPKALVGAEKDAAVRMEATLREEWMTGMPSQEEMRKSPPGAVEKHMQWEARNKEKITQWKNLRLRLHASDGDYTDGSVANIERFRPQTNTLLMDNAQIPGKQFFLPPDGARPGVTFSAEQLALLAEVSPDLAGRLALLNNVPRAEVKEVVNKTLHLPTKGGKAAPADDPL